MTRKQPATSLEAYAELTQEQITNHYKKIIDSLKVLKAANYERISKQCNLDRHAVGRRLKEMEKLGLIWKQGGRANTTTGRSAFLWQLSSDKEVHLVPIEKAIKKGKSIADYSKAIQKLSTPIPQLNLFQ